MQTDIRVREIQTFKVPTACRTPLKFGAVVVEKTFTGYAKATVETRDGKTGVGWGAMFIMDLWAWPVSKASHEARERAMADLLDACAACAAEYPRYAHPIEIFCETEHELRRLAARAAAEHTPDDEMPFLAALVVASIVDHAVHDAFGNANGIDTYRAMGPDHMGFDLSRYLGDAYRGVYPSQFLQADYLPRVPLFHLIGGLDVLRETDVPGGLPDDGVPNSLEKWIERDGVFCLKVKLRGTDMAWDIDRTLEVSRIYHEVRTSRRPDLPVIGSPLGDGPAKILGDGDAAWSAALDDLGRSPSGFRPDAVMRRDVRGAEERIQGGGIDNRVRHSRPQP